MITSKNAAWLALAFAVLGGCAAPAPKSDGDNSVVEFVPQRGVSMLADSQDGQTVDQGSYFIVLPGSHTLSVKVKEAINPNFDKLYLGNISYQAFKPNARYSLRYDDIGRFKTLSLLENSKVVATQTEFSTLR